MVVLEFVLANVIKISKIAELAATRSDYTLYHSENTFRQTLCITLNP